MSASLRRIAFAIATLAPLAATVGTALAADAPIDGIRCEAMEGTTMHIHQHVSIFDRGRPVGVPANVGRPADGTCFYWLHTHTPDGIVHVESPSYRDFTLGEFFDVWGEPLSRTVAASARAPRGATLRVTVDGVPYAGDPRAIDLTQHADVVIQAGPPFVRAAPFTAWNGN